MKFKCKRCKTSFVNTPVDQIKCSVDGCPIKKVQAYEMNDELDFSEFPKETCEIISEVEIAKPKFETPAFNDNEWAGWPMYD